MGEPKTGFSKQPGGENIRQTDLVQAQSVASKETSQNLLEEAVRSAFNSGIQSPYNGIAQLWNETGGKLTGAQAPAMELVAPPKEAEFGSASWHAQTIGGAAGMVVPFLVCRKAANQLGKGAQVAATRYYGEAATAQLINTNLARTALPILSSGTAGAMFDGVMRPVKNTDTATFWKERATNAGIGFTVFGTLHAGSAGLKHLDQAILSANKPWLVNTFHHDLARNIISGAGAGVVESNLRSLASGQGLASSQEMLKGAYTFSLLGGLTRTTGEIYARGVKGEYTVSDIINRDAGVQKLLSGSKEVSPLLTEFGDARVKISEVGKGPAQGDAVVSKTARLVSELSVAEARTMVAPGKDWQVELKEKLAALSPEAKPYIVLFGGPACGKGTVGADLAAEFGLPLLNFGNIIRWHVDHKTEIGVAIKPTIDKGGMIPDQVTFNLLMKELEKPEYANGAILDGVPRKIGQAQMFQDFLAERGTPIRQAIHIKTPEADIMERITERRICSNEKCDSPSYHLKRSPPKKEGCCDRCSSPLKARPEDTPQVVRTRIDDSINLTEGPLAKLYADHGQLSVIESTNAMTPKQVSALAIEAAQPAAVKLQKSFDAAKDNLPDKNWLQSRYALMRQRMVMDEIQQSTDGNAQLRSGFDQARTEWGTRWNQQVTPAQELLAKLTMPGQTGQRVGVPVSLQQLTTPYAMANNGSSFLNMLKRKGLEPANIGTSAGGSSPIPLLVDLTHMELPASRSSR